ncbi:MAG: hypothetical protein ACYC8S_02180 [Minisyncoccota bacterium]
MDTTTTYDTLEDTLLSLPEDLQIALGSRETLAKVWRIGWDHKLGDEQIELLVEEVAHVFLGITPIHELSQKLASQLKITPQDAEEIAQNITTNILAPYENLINSLGAPPSEDGGVGANIKQPTFVDSTPSIHPLAPPSAPLDASPAQDQNIAPAPVVVPEQAPVPSSMFEEKLKRVFSMPRQDPRGISGQNASLGNPPTPPSPQGTPSDPYRESVG